mgnify:CR=1 FL=1
MTVRRLGPEDLEAFRSIRLEALRLEPENYASHYDDWVSLSDDQWRARLDDVIAVAAFDTDQPIGVMAVKQERSPKMRHRGMLVMVYLRKSYRGAGIAREILDHLGRHSIAEGMLQLELHVNAANRTAIRFYEKAGFETIGKLPRAAREGDDFIDDLLMVKPLDT